MIKAIVFDKDGTLIEHDDFWLPVARGAISGMLFARSLDTNLTEDIMRAVGAYDGITGAFCHGTYKEIADLMNTVIKRHSDIPVTPTELEKALTDNRNSGELRATCENIIDVFERLKQMGLKTAVVTSDTLPMTEICLQKLGIARFFEKLCTDDGSPSKPDPYHMNALCRELGLQPSEVLMVGDTLTDMDFAENSGAVAVGVAKASDAKKILSSRTKFVIDDVSQIFEVLEKAGN